MESWSTITVTLAPNNEAGSSFQPRSCSGMDSFHRPKGGRTPGAAQTISDHSPTTIFNHQKKNPFATLVMQRPCGETTTAGLPGTVAVIAVHYPTVEIAGTNGSG